MGGGLQYRAPAEEVEADRPETVTAYLSALAMYMLALAMWGSKPRDPSPAEQESRDGPCGLRALPLPVQPRLCASRE